MGLFDGAVGGAIGAVGSLIGGGISASQSRANANLNYSAQREFAQNGIRWRVEDAKKAGIHPLYALGASTASFSPVSGYGGDFGISDALNSFGQGIDRAAQAKMTKEERAIEQANLERQEVMQLADLNMRQHESDARVNALNASAYRDYVAARAAVTNQQQVPAMPSLRVRPDGTVVGQTVVGQGDSSPVNGLIEVEPSSAETNAPGRPGTTAASNPELSFSRTNDGGYVPIRSESAADRLDDDILGTLSWYARNYIPAYFDNQASAPPKSWLPKGASHWVFDSANFAWYPNTHRRGYNMNPFSELPLGRSK